MRILLPSMLLGSLMTACDNNCDFFERCSGDVQEICGGVDQMFGRRVHATDCRDTGQVCIEIDEHTAGCVAEPVTECDPGEFTGYCEDSRTAHHCDTTYEHVVATPCEPGNECTEATAEGGNDAWLGQCVHSPMTECDETTVSTCDNNAALNCDTAIGLLLHTGCDTRTCEVRNGNAICM